MSFSPGHPAHELQSLNVHFRLNGLLSRAHQPLHPATTSLIFCVRQYDNQYNAGIQDALLAKHSDMHLRSSLCRVDDVMSRRRDHDTLTPGGDMAVVLFKFY